MSRTIGAGAFESRTNGHQDTWLRIIEAHTFGSRTNRSQTFGSRDNWVAYLGQIVIWHFGNDGHFGKNGECRKWGIRGM